MHRDMKRALALVMLFVAAMTIGHVCSSLQAIEVTTQDGALSSVSIKARSSLYP